MNAALGKTLLACITSIVGHGFTMMKTPVMAQVVPGTEPKINGRAMWDCEAPTAKCYETLLDAMAKNMLALTSLQGKPALKTAGVAHFKQPQTSGSNGNMHDTSSYMPACRNFPRGSPFTKHETVSATSKTWYTWVRLGKDKDGRVVREHAHVLIAAARFGVPNTWLDPNTAFKDKHIARHCPTCPGGRGGCCNPLHIRWGTQAANKLDQGLKRAVKGKGVHVGRAVKLAPPLMRATTLGVAATVMPMRVTRSKAKLERPP